MKFELELPDRPTTFFTEHKKLFEDWGTEGSSFVLYALIQDCQENVEHQVTRKRSKGGFVEQHWGTRGSVLNISGTVGFHLSLLGVSPFMNEDPDSNPERVTYWDPSATTVLTDTPLQIAGNKDLFDQKLMDLGNKVASTLAARVNPKLSDLNVNYKNTKTEVDANGNTVTPLQKALSANKVSADQAARIGTNIAFRRFRELLDLFKYNGIIMSSHPNPDIYPSTFTADEIYVDKNGQEQRLPAGNVSDSTSLVAARLNSNTAPGNVRGVTPIRLYIKDAVYTGYFQNFTYSLDDKNPFLASYELTFIANTTERSAVFFPVGSAGRKPFSSMLDLKGKVVKDSSQTPGTATAQKTNTTATQGTGAPQSADVLAAGAIAPGSTAAAPAATTGNPTNPNDTVQEVAPAVSIADTAAPIPALTSLSTGATTTSSATPKDAAGMPFLPKGHYPDKNYLLLWYGNPLNDLNTAQDAYDTARTDAGL
jgi:hypothetical protein